MRQRGIFSTSFRLIPSIISHCYFIIIRHSLFCSVDYSFSALCCVVCVSSWCFSPCLRWLIPSNSNRYRRLSSVIVDIGRLEPNPAPDCNSFKGRPVEIYPRICRFMAPEDSQCVIPWSSFFKKSNFIENGRQWRAKLSGEETGAAWLGGRGANAIYRRMREPHREIDVNSPLFFSIFFFFSVAISGCWWERHWTRIYNREQIVRAPSGNVP